MKRRFDVTNLPIVADEVAAAVAGPAMGAVVVFNGIVRDHSEGRSVTLLEYEAYASMARKEMARIAEDIERELPGVRLTALHRVGALRVGDVAVVCAAAAPHREQAFDACRRLIDRVKERVPIWKREHGPDGPHWVGWQDARSAAHGEDHAEHDGAAGHAEHDAGGERRSGSK